MATRKTHIVRIYDDSSGTKDKSTYVDVEVLDACVFRRINDREVILKLPAAQAKPLIVDDVGVGAAKDPGSGATRKSHMKKIESSDKKSFFAVEVLDAVVFRGQDGREWILKMPDEKAEPYNSTDGGASSGATRRTHSEKVYFDPAQKGKKGADLITVERCDAVAFRRINSREVILKMPSHDDGSGERASSLTTPENYDPTDDNMKVPENSDPHVYFKFMKDTKDLVTGSTKIPCGPLWWIRKIHTGSEWLVIEIIMTRSNAASSGFTMTNNFNGTDVTETTTGDKQMPFVQNGAAGQKPDGLDLKKDKVLSGNPNTDNALDWTVLIFVNVALARGDNLTKALEVDIRIPGFPTSAAPPDSVGYYMWTDKVLGADGSILPAPNATNLFQWPPPGGPIYDPLSGEPLNYINVFNNPASWLRQFPQITNDCRNLGIPVPAFPYTGAFGAPSAAVMQAFIDALNTTSLANWSGLGDPPATAVLLVIHFTDPDPTKTPHLTATVRGLHYKSRVNYPYSATNTPQFPDPTPSSSEIVSKVIDDGVPSNTHTLKIVLDPKNGLSMTDDETAP